MTPADLDIFDRPLFAQWLGAAQPASEQLYYLEMPVAHVVAYEEHRRERRFEQAAAAGMRSERVMRSPT